MKEEMIRLAKHYENLTKTASGMIAKNAEAHLKDILRGHPYVEKELKKNDSTK